MAIPLSITKYIRSMWMAETIITYLHVDKQGNLQSWGGHPRHYGLSNLIADRPATEQLYFLEGLLTTPHSQKLEFVGLAADRYAHVSIIPTTEGTWVLLFDATAAHDQKQKMQQQVNELSLLTYRQSQLLQGLEATRKSLEEEKQKLEEVIESKTNYISTLIKTMQMPMECVDGYQQLLNKVELIEARTTDYLNVVKDNTNQLLSDINHVLDETKSEAGQVALYISHCEIKVLLENLVSIFQPVAQAKGLLFHLEIKENVPPRVMLDELRFQQILINLITNGLKFTPKGFVTVTVGWEQQQLHFVVADSGSGISPEAQQKIFMPPLPNTTDKSMGLVISQHFVKLMGGQLTVESSPKMGSMFKGFVQAPLPLVHNTLTDRLTMIERSIQ